MADIQYFLGGNTPMGFYSLYHQLSDPDRTRILYILKGGAGCGKSTLMRRVLSHAHAAGLEAELIPCSGDPDSLDGVIFPALGTAIADGTAPHVMEADYAGAVEQYVDLSCYYDHAALQPLRPDILTATQEYRRHYKRAYRCLDAAGKLRQDEEERLNVEALRLKLQKRAKGIIHREIKAAKTGQGRLSQRFLTAVTHKGPVVLWSTVTAQADRIYRLSDRYGLAHHLLSPVLTAALAAGQDVTACPDPMRPDRIAHLILPELSLAFVTDCPDFPWTDHTYRHLRLDAAAEADLPSTVKPCLRFSRKVSGALMDEAISALAQAKTAHDRLETLYNPHVDFEGVCRLADGLAEKIISSH